MYLCTCNYSSPQAGIICDANQEHLVQLNFDFDAGVKMDKKFRCDVSKWSSDKIDMKSFSHLTSLVFRKQGMYGQLPASLCELPSLSRLDLSWNKLKGGLQSLFDNGAQPRNMRLLDLSHNQLTGI